MERLLVYDNRWVGRPLTRDDEGRRDIAQTTKRQPSSQSRDEGRRQTTKRQTSSQSRDEERRDIAQTTKRQTSSQSLDTASHYAILAQFAVLFVLGMLSGIAAVCIAFML